MADHDFDQSGARFGGGCRLCGALPGEGAPCEPAVVWTGKAAKR